MDNNSNNKTTYEVVDFSNNESSKKEKNSFSKSVLVPFFSGILGTSLIIGICFGVPEIKEKILGYNHSTITTSTSR